MEEHRDGFWRGKYIRIGVIFMMKEKGIAYLNQPKLVLLSRGRKAFILEHDHANISHFAKYEINKYSTIHMHN